MTQSCFNSIKLNGSQAVEVNTPCHWIPLWNLDSLKKHLVLLRGPTKTAITAQKPHHLSPPLAPQPWLSSACRKPPALLETNVQVHPIRTSLLLPWSHCTKTIPLFTTLKEEHLQNAKHLQTKLRKNLFPASCPPYHSFHIFHSLHGFKSFYSFDSLQDFHGLQSI